MNHHEIVDVMEVCTAKKVGSERLFTEYLYFYVEKNISKFTLPLYVRALRVLGDQQYTEDPIFWTDYMFPWIYTRTFSQPQAQRLWTELISLRIKSPSITNINVVISYVESLLSKFELIDGFADMDLNLKKEIQMRGDLPDGVRIQMSKSGIQLTGQDSSIAQANAQVKMETKL